VALTEPGVPATAAAPADPAATAPGTTVPAASAAAGSGTAAPTLRRRHLLGSRRRQAGAVVVIAGAVAFLLVQGLGSATQYYKTVPQAVADRARLGSSQFRIMGTVDHDVRQVNGDTVFSVSYGGVTAQVVDHREPPQLFQEGVPVVLEGHWSGTVFQSDLIMVKHTAVYNPAERTVMSTMPTAPGAGPGQTTPAGPGTSAGSGR
jgi:cytochrome c-type biogenesis protein CcmE